MNFNRALGPALRTVASPLVAAALAGVQEVVKHLSRKTDNNIRHVQG